MILIPPCECITCEEVELITSTLYVMSGSTPVISKVKGGFQVREMVESSAVAFRSPTAESRPR